MPSPGRGEALAALSQIATGVLVRDAETETLEFKQDRAAPAEMERILTEAAICFANSAGGTIVVGVADNMKGAAALIGTQIEPLRIRQRIYELSRPPLAVEVERYPARPGILLIHVPQSSDIHSDTQGRAYRRINRDCLPMDPWQQERLREERRGLDWSAQPSGLVANQLSGEALAMARRMLLTLSDNRRSLARLPDRDLLGSLGVLAHAEELNRAGALLFGPPDALLPESLTYQFRATPGGDPQAVERLASPAILTFARVLDLISARQTLTPLTLPNGQQIQIENFPSLAVREAISNALCHRDYHALAPIQIEHSPAVLVITSPGPLVSGVTPSNILTIPSRPRNRTLAKAARILGLAEETGRGVDRMYREMIRSGRPIPTITSDFDAVRVALTGGAPDTYIARFVAGLPEEERDDTDTMLIIFRLCSSRTITAVQAAPWLQKSSDEAEAVLHRLATDEIALLERTRHSIRRTAGVFRLRGDTLKRLGSAVTYNRRTIDETDRKVIAHVRDYGKITNRMLQNFFDVDVFRARDIIGDLVKRGILVRTSAQQRGSRVEWGKGPKFPIKGSRS